MHAQPTSFEVRNTVLHNLDHKKIGPTADELVKLATGIKIDCEVAVPKVLSLVEDAETAAEELLV